MRRIETIWIAGICGSLGLAACTGSSPDATEDLMISLVEDVATRTRSMERINELPAVAQTLCVDPYATAIGALESRAKAGSPHGEKIYHLYVTSKQTYREIVAGGEAPVGFSAVKEVWDETTSEDDVFDRISPPGVVGLFLMTKLDPSTQNTDNGWVYGVVTPTGDAFDWGMINSCIKCHTEADGDRMLGLGQSQLTRVP